MKHRFLLDRLRRQGCVLVREGRRHTIVRNPANGAESQVPRHREVKLGTMRGICKDLGIEPPREA
jgi:mRNA interferase HicA